MSAVAHIWRNDKLKNFLSADTDPRFKALQTIWQTSATVKQFAGVRRLCASKLTGVAGAAQPSIRTAADSWSHADSPVPAVLRTDCCREGKKVSSQHLSMLGS